MKQHRLLLAFFVALALLSSQWVLATHGHQEDWLHPEPDCQLCQHALQFHAFAATQPSHQPIFSLLDCSHETPFNRHLASLALGYYSRGPPDLV